MYLYNRNISALCVAYCLFLMIAVSLFVIFFQFQGRVQVQGCATVRRDRGLSCYLELVDEDGDVAKPLGTGCVSRVLTEVLDYVVELI